MTHEFINATTKCELMNDSETREKRGKRIKINSWIAEKFSD